MKQKSTNLCVSMKKIKEKIIKFKENVGSVKSVVIFHSASFKYMRRFSVEAFLSLESL